MGTTGELRARARGEVLAPPDGGYEAARAAWCPTRHTVVESVETENVMSVLIRICGDEAGIVGAAGLCS